MGQRVQFPYLQTREARSKLARSREPRWWPIAPGFHLGYRRPKSEVGTLYGRLRAGSAYRKTVIGLAHDRDDADRTRTLDFSQAVDAARRWAAGVAGTG
jgi:hypothetical protein